MVHKVCSNIAGTTIKLNFDIFCLEAELFLLIRNAQTRQLSHPLPVLRANEIDEWSRSSAYRSLLKRGIPIRSQQQKL